MMLSAMFLLLYFLAPIITGGLLYLAGVKVNRISIVAFVVVSLLLFSVVGTFPLYFHLDIDRYETGVQDKMLVFKVLATSLVAIVLFLLGVVFVRAVLGLNSKECWSGRFYRLSTIQKLALVIILFISLAFFFLYLNKVDSIALFKVFTSGFEQAKVARSNMGNNFSVGYHWYQLFLYEVSYFITFVSFAAYLKFRTKSMFFVFLLLLLYSSFISVMAIEKGPIVWLFIGLFCVYFVVVRNGYVSWKGVVVLLGMTVVVLAILFKFFFGSESIVSALVSVFSRAFSGSIEPAYYYLEIFPDYIDHTYGRTLPNPGGLLKFEPFRYAVEVANIVNPSLSERGITGSMPTVFWGEAYINWGYWGIGIVSFSVGVFVALVDYFFARMAVNSLTVGAYVWVLLLFKDLAISGFSSVFVNIYLYGILGIFMIVMAVRGHIKLKPRHLVVFKNA